MPDVIVTKKMAQSRLAPADNRGSPQIGVQHIVGRQVLPLAGGTLQLRNDRGNEKALTEETYALARTVPNPSSGKCSVSGQNTPRNDSNFDSARGAQRKSAEREGKDYCAVPRFIGEAALDAAKVIVHSPLLKRLAGILAAGQRQLFSTAHPNEA
ncbi:hypothetical protein FJY94_09460 [Candidatus Kaiserbacteria bacterium]|nr:hypothetical protein [Candidatus Kaiserbacteria bacterium]